MVRRLRPPSANIRINWMTMLYLETKLKKKSQFFLFGFVFSSRCSLFPPVVLLVVYREGTAVCLPFDGFDVSPVNNLPLIGPLAQLVERQSNKLSVNSSILLGTKATWNFLPLESLYDMVTTNIPAL